MLSRRDILLISGHLKNKLNQKKSVIFYKKLEEDKDFKAEFQKRLLETRISEIEKKIFDLIERVSPGENNMFRKRFSLKNYLYSNAPDKELKSTGFIDKLVPSSKENFEVITEFLDIRRKVIELSNMAGNIMEENAYLSNLDMLLKDTGITYKDDKEQKLVGPKNLETSKKRKKIIAVVPIAASIILLIGLGFKLSFQGKSSTDNLFTDFYSPFQKIQFVAASSGNEIEYAKEEYNKGKYYSALTILQSVPDSDPQVIDRLFYTGLSYMALNEFEKATFSFQSLTSKAASNEFLHQAEWYLGLCYLKTGEKDEAYQQFSTIAIENVHFSNKAKKILRKLKRIKYIRGEKI
jgi:tetratricopeptide (TPR) repeat protein